MTFNDVKLRKHLAPFPVSSLAKIVPAIAPCVPIKLRITMTTVMSLADYNTASYDTSC